MNNKSHGVPHYYYYHYYHHHLCWCTATRTATTTTTTAAATATTTTLLLWCMLLFSSLWSSSAHYIDFSKKSCLLLSSSSSSSSLLTSHFIVRKKKNHFRYFRRFTWRVGQQQQQQQQHCKLRQRCSYSLFSTTTRMSSSNSNSNNSSSNMQSNNTNNDSNDNNNNHKIQRHLVVILTGPTAVGKSSIATRLVQSSLSNNNPNNQKNAGMMIVSADSVQVYKHVSIGANKPSVKEQQQTPHLLVDVVDMMTTKDNNSSSNNNNNNSSSSSSSCSNYNAAEWQQDALQCIYELLGLSSSSSSPPPSNDVDDTHDDNDNDVHITTRMDTQNSATERQQRQQQCMRTSMIHQSIQTALASKQLKPPVTPILTGGTMMYLQWLVEGRPDAVPCTITALDRAKTKLVQLQQQQLQQQLQQQAEQSEQQPELQQQQQESCSFSNNKGWQQTIQTVNQELGEPFATQAAKLSEHDWYRLRRILEVAYTLQEEEEQQQQQQQQQIVSNDEEHVKTSNTQQQEKQQQQQAELAQVYSGKRQGGLLSDDRLDVRCFFLCPSDRQAHARIVDDRCEQMLQAGLLQETTQLAVMMNNNSNKNNNNSTSSNGGAKSLSLPDMIQKAIGYRQALEYLGRDNFVKNDVAALETFLHDFQGATRRYAKRQTQWFRKDPRYFFVPVDTATTTCTDIGKIGAEAVQKATAKIMRLLQLSRAEFDLERTASNSISQTTRQQSQAQAKMMRTYLSTRTRLIPDSPALHAVLQQADECTQQFRQTQTYRDMQSTMMKRKERDVIDDNIK